MRPFLLSIIAIIGLASCAQTHLDKGLDAFDRMAYKKATRHFEKYLAKKADPIVEVKTATAYEQIKDYKKAEEHYATALQEAHPNTAPTIKLKYAQVLLTNGKKEAAITWGKAYLQATPSDKAAEKWLKSLQQSDIVADTDTAKTTLQLIHLEGFTGAYSAVSIGGKVYFTGEKEASSSQKANPITGKTFFDIYAASKGDNNTLNTPKVVAGMDAKFHDGPLCFTQDGNNAYITRSATQVDKKLEKDASSTNQLKIYGLQRSYGEWILHESSLSFNMDNASTMHPALSPDGQKLFFASDRPGGQGGMDLYFVEKEGSGWSKPSNLGFAVNSPNNEVFPFLTTNDTLYFTSDKIGGMGGLDLYMSVLVAGKWTAPTPLQAPFNTAFDDFSFFKYADKEAGYISSNRNGKDQIYAWATQITEPIVTPPLPEIDTVVAIPPPPKLVFKVSGKVVDSKTKIGLSEVEVQLLDEEEKILKKLTTNSDGTFAFDLSPHQVYQLHGVRKNSFTRNKVVSTYNVTESKTFEVELELEIVELATTITLKNIYYDYGKSDIRSDAAEELKNLVRFMKDNPKVSIQVNSHTDSQGKDAENLLLSDKRAQAVRDYLLTQGITVERVVAKGFGETKLVNNCDDGIKCSEEQHQANRRTEFTVLKLE